MKYRIIFTLLKWLSKKLTKNKSTSIGFYCIIMDGHNTWLYKNGYAEEHYNYYTMNNVSKEDQKNTNQY